MDLLDNTIRPYAWGSTTAIPRLLGTEPTGEPQAEMWMGAHPGAPSRLVRNGTPTSLDIVVGADPENELGKDVTARFGPRLPFLFKVLAAGSPLSLQVHPDLEQARAGFADEEARGIPVDAAHRNYKDANHKPEMICALEPFDGLCGFRDPRRTADLLDALAVSALQPWIDVLRTRPEEEALREVLTGILSADRQAFAATATEVAAAAERVAAAGGPWAEALAAYAGIAHAYPGDPGLVAAMLLNHVRLSPGEALFLGAGVPHAYLSGLGVELMANSDNVLRCGLTPKHVDVPELLRIVRFASGEAEVLRPEPHGDEQVYPAPIDEFRLSRLVLDQAAADGSPVELPTGTPQIVLCTEGRILLTPLDGAADGAALELTAGRSAYLAATDGPVRLTGSGTLFRATVGA
ncbi:mannose-6-phosphate isomerase, class I [Allostreptomyces psammosilenae]|uniref:mannose-6-phosphate isomerase n=1 Tax=Allostreptomyces psammosilenae TaxID=1892865 RepID=A0A853A650_9ACTN|nr:mannose-6-phosphate isomerase, class I [Allostreptomyces psammosilenae]NYI06161.1 mannose-6-phosphate isomerase [Allostreptomyces psammosilenae]